MNEIPDLVQRAPRVNRNAEQVLFRFLGFGPVNLDVRTMVSPTL